jgi:NTP pyrophosphatase (non-canonical NTP hydrolase)
MNPLLIEQCLHEVYRMAFIIAGETDEVAEAVLAGMRHELEETVPPEMLDSLFNAIRRCKAGIERGATVSRH